MLPLPVRTMVMTPIVIFSSGAIGALVGYIAGGSRAMAVAAVVFAAAGTGAWLLFVRSSITAAEQAAAEAEEHGYEEGLADAVFGLVTSYQHAVFPLSGPGGVLPQERIARRSFAYSMAAAEQLPEPVRRAAADALAVLGVGEDEKVAAEAVKQLAFAIHVHRKGL
ncbi:hypothetical protein J7E96_35855 [Streptomyces sp. ISL-96]|uniref:hypothetical protein n=1 Tax=Streptomyces sp. ISL-96 TaxID=2819191 RepID=UPI001BEC85AE|nr:hypothetical protein [Streptomyces sp. ISL-96]MBT2493778.1 hypothetical protein [Streptomyces sp. ISL-96]